MSETRSVSTFKSLENIKPLTKNTYFPVYDTLYILIVESHLFEEQRVIRIK